MIQDIAPHQFYNEFNRRPPEDQDFILFFERDQVKLEQQEGILNIPRFGALQPNHPELAEQMVYLFAVDQTAFYLGPESFEDFPANYCDKSIRFMLQLKPGWMGFAAITGYHLYHWYHHHSYCGNCGEPMQHHSQERALYCADCDWIEYPTIAPVIMVGITNGEQLLLTRYSRGAYRNYALIAGFVEIGESLEAAVKREVWEEVGLKVGSLRYYKSQPWGVTQTILAGYFAELDGSPEVRLDEAELAEAVWVHRDELPQNDNNDNFSLTFDMIEAFRSGKI